MIWYSKHVRRTLHATGLFLRDGDEVAFNLRVDGSGARNPYQRQVRAAMLAMHLIGQHFRGMIPVLRRTVDAMVEFKKAFMAPVDSA